MPKHTHPALTPKKRRKRKLIADNKARGREILDEEIRKDFHEDNARDREAGEMGMKEEGKKPN